MTTSLIATLGAILILLVASGFFSGSETALTAASRPRIHHLAERGNRRARMVRALQDQRDQLIGAILLGNNLVNILASALATSVLIGYFGEAGVFYATLVMTLLVLIFAEVLPKTYALGHAERMSLVVAPPVRAVVLVLAPVVTAVQWVVRATLRLFGATIPVGFSMDASEEELRGAIALHAEETEEAASERAMLSSILDLGDVEVGEIMTHRRNVEMIDIALPVEAILQRALASRFTRMPLYRDHPDNVVAVLHVKALLRALREAGDDLSKLNIEEIASEPWFVPDTTTLIDQMRAFQDRREHIAIVVDEYGALEGLITLEDILEEIVGDILDEHDLPVRGVRPQPDGSYVIDGSVTLRDLNREFGWNLPDEEASTIAGLLLHEAKRIPEPGQVFEFHGVRCEVLRRQRNQITSLRLMALPAAKRDAPA